MTFFRLLSDVAFLSGMGLLVWAAWGAVLRCGLFASFFCGYRQFARLLANRTPYAADHGEGCTTARRGPRRLLPLAAAGALLLLLSVAACFFCP